MKTTEQKKRADKVYIGPDSEKMARLVAIIVVAAIILIVVMGVAFCNVSEEDVTVTGNYHYTDEQIKAMVLDGRFGHNAIVLFFKYKNKSITNIPFVETMEVKMESSKSISITVYEKAIAGYVEYLDQFMYFDKDGIVVESSSIRQKDIPCIAGLSFDHVVLYERLPIADEKVFKNIMSLTQLLNKYNITTDKIYFDSDEKVTLYFDNAKVQMGSLDEIDEKMIKLQGIIPKLEGLKGTLYMENYGENSDSQYITFQRDDVQKHIEIYDDSVSLNKVEVQE